MRIVLHSRFSNGRRMERVIKSQEDIDRACEHFERRHKEALKGVFEEDHTFEDELELNWYPYLRASIQHGTFNTSGSWNVGDEHGIREAALELRGELLRLLLLEKLSMLKPVSPRMLRCL